MKSNKKLWIIIAGIVMSGACLPSCVALVIASGLGTTAYNTLTAESAVGAGKTAPDFELTSLKGQTIRLSQYRGKPVIVNFSATWCPDCKKEAPILQNAHASHPELVVLSIDLNEDSQTVQAFADKYGLTFDILLDRDGRVGDVYRVYAIPTLYFVDRDGTIRARLVETSSSQQLEEALTAIGVR